MKEKSIRTAFFWGAAESSDLDDDLVACRRYVIRAIIESSLAQALATSQKQMDGWLKGALDGAIRNAQDALVAVTRDFRVKLLGA